MSSQEISGRERGVAPPTATWGFMLCALVLTLLLPTLSSAVMDRVGTQTLWPLALLGPVILLGILGAVFALLAHKEAAANPRRFTSRGSSGSPAPTR